MKSFEKDFYEFVNAKRQEMKEKYNRVLPTGELIFNRFDKAKYLDCGEGTSIYDTSIIMGDVKIGNNVWVGPYTILEGLNEDLIIRDFVSIDAGVMIYTHDSTKYFLTGGAAPYEKGKVEIGHNTVIGTMSMIGYGVTIGNHCVIGAHSFVNKNIPDYCIAVGVPAKIIGKVVINNKIVSFEYFEKGV